MIENNYLQELLKHTNIILPFNTDRNIDYISATKFPPQDEKLINTRVTIKYRDFSTRTNPVTIEKAALITDIESDEKISSRPEDDVQKPQESHLTPEELTEMGPYVEREFIVLRADAIYPYILIAITDDYSMLVVNSSYYDEMTEKYVFEDHISEYPIQQFKYIGASCISKYRDGQLDALVFRADANEPSISILYETAQDEYGNDYHRFVLGDELRADFIGLITANSDDIYNFADLDYYENPDPPEPEYDLFNFGDITEEDYPDLPPEYQIDYDFGEMEINDGVTDLEGNFDFHDLIEEPDSDLVPYDLYNFGDISEEDFPDYPVEYEKDYDFGDIDVNFGKTDLEGMYDFGDLIYGIEPGSETLKRYFPEEPVNWNGSAQGDWDFGDLDGPDNPDTVVRDNTNYDFNIFAMVNNSGMATNENVAKYRKNIMEGEENDGNL